MKKQCISFPSVFEATGTKLSFVSKDLINGLQLFDNQDQTFIIGDLALNEGLSPNRLVNSSPYELDYKLLLQAALLLANHHDNRPIALTTGFPFSTYQIYKEMAKDSILKLQSVDYNAGTFSTNDRLTISTPIAQVEILPEMIGNIIGLRVGEEQASGNFFVVSLGYGTCEAVLSTENGIVHRTALSINGMQYAIDLFMRSLASKYYLGLKTEKQLDVSFRNDYIILGRQKISIIDLRRRILERYYYDVVSPGLRKSFTDTDFERADKIYLTGGGALFPELTELFEKEFNQIAKVVVVKNPLTLTSEGYSLNSVMLANGDERLAVGLDIGNANTVLTQYVTEQNSVFERKDEKKVDLNDKQMDEVDQEKLTETSRSSKVKIKPEVIDSTDLSDDPEMPDEKINKNTQSQVEVETPAYDYEQKLKNIQNSENYEPDFS